MNSKQKLSYGLIIVGIILIAGSAFTPLSVLYGQSATTYVGQPTSVLCYEGFGPQSSTGATITYDLTWGDGSPDTVANTLATQYTFTHTYATAGNYLAVCTVTANGTSQGVGDTTITVNPAPIVTTVTSTQTSNGQTSLVTTTTTSQVSTTQTGITLISATATNTITASQKSNTPSPLAIIGILLILGGGYIGFVRKK